MSRKKGAKPRKYGLGRRAHCLECVDAAGQRLWSPGRYCVPHKDVAQRRQRRIEKNGAICVIVTRRQSVWPEHPARPTQAKKCDPRCLATHGVKRSLTECLEAVDRCCKGLKNPGRKCEKMLKSKRG